MLSAANRTISALTSSLAAATISLVGWNRAIETSDLLIESSLTSLSRGVMTEGFEPLTDVSGVGPSLPSSTPILPLLVSALVLLLSISLLTLIQRSCLLEAEVFLTCNTELSLILPMRAQLPMSVLTRDSFLALVLPHQLSSSSARRFSQMALKFCRNGGLVFGPREHIESAQSRLAVKSIDIEDSARPSCILSSAKVRFDDIEDMQRYR